MTASAGTPQNYNTPTLPQLDGGDPIFWRNELQKISKSINLLTRQFNTPFATLLGLRWGPTTAGIPSVATGELYFDNTGAYAEQDSALNVTVDLGAAAPPGVIPTTTLLSLSQGNNTTFVGGAALKLVAKDRASVNSSNKGVLYPLYCSVQPSVARNNSPFDDATGHIIQNDGTAKAADGLYVGTGSGGIVGAQWANAIAVNTLADYLLRGLGTYTTGIDISGATLSGNAFASPGFAVTSGGTVVANGLQSSDYLVTGTPTSLSGTSGTISFGAPSVVISASGTFTATLPSPSQGAWLWLKNATPTQTVNAGSSNVVPLGSTTAGLQIFGATAGITKWAFLQATASQWIVMAGL